MRRVYDVSFLADLLTARGNRLSGGRVPLMRQYTGTTISVNICWRYDFDDDVWRKTSDVRCPLGQLPHMDRTGETTATAWRLLDFNGVGGLDFLMEPQGPRTVIRGAPAGSHGRQAQARAQPECSIPSENLIEITQGNYSVEDSNTLGEREILLKGLQRLRNQIESVLFTQGYRDVPNTTRELKAWLEARREVGAQLRERLTREVARLALLEQQCQAVAKELARQVRQEQTSDIAVVARALMQLCGIGLIGAWVLASELFGWRQFRNRREVGAALGLTPTPYSSGEDQREQGISKAGNRRARTMLVELAWL